MLDDILTLDCLVDIHLFHIVLIDMANNSTGRRRRIRIRMRIERRLRNNQTLSRSATIESPVEKVGVDIGKAATGPSQTRFLTVSF